MKTPVKLILGAVATGCIAVGVAAQTGTVQIPRDNSRPATVSGQPQGAPATVEPSATPGTSPAPTTLAVSQSSDDEDGGDGGDGQGQGNGHGNKH